VHNAAALIAGGLISDPDAIELNQVGIAQDAIYLVVAVDAALAEREKAESTAPTEDAIAAAHARGLADGRANPWRPMGEYDGQAAIVAGRPPFGSRTGLAYIRQVPHGYRALPADFGWLPLPTLPAE
jgi:hypothetical protein